MRSRIDILNTVILQRNCVWKCVEPTYSDLALRHEESRVDLLNTITLHEDPNLLGSRLDIINTIRPSRRPFLVIC